jgi:predicted PurR-regulated permease PerM
MTDHKDTLHWTNLLLTIIALPVLVIVLKTLRGIFIPLIFSIFLTFVFAPITRWLEKRKVPMWVTLIILLLIIIAVFAVMLGLLYSAGNSIITGLPRYQERFVQLVNDAVEFVVQQAENMNLDVAALPHPDFGQLLTSGAGTLTKTISGTMGSVVVALMNLVITLIFMMFIVSGANSLERRLKKALGSTRNAQTMEAMQSIQDQLQNYLVTKSLISLGTAIAGSILMWIFGVDFILVCALIRFVMNYIPNIGSVISSVLPMLICLLQHGLGIRTILFAILTVALEMLSGNVIEPKIQGNRMDLSPLTVLIALIFWGWVWGVMGMIFAVPMTAAINIVLKQLKPNNIVSAIISGS